jgi:Cyclin, N-terminal domain
MTSILIASKYEDIIPIPADSLIKKAGHNKFTLTELIALERDVLLSLKFKIHLTADIYNESALLFNNIMMS